MPSGHNSAHPKTSQAFISNDDPTIDPAVESRTPGEALGSRLVGGILRYRKPAPLRHTASGVRSRKSALRGFRPARRWNAGKLHGRKPVTRRQASRADARPICELRGRRCLRTLRHHTGRDHDPSSDHHAGEICSGGQDNFAVNHTFAEASDSSGIASPRRRSAPIESQFLEISSCHLLTWRRA